MSQTNAAVVTSFEEPPHYAQIDMPTAGPDQVCVDVLAAGLVCETANVHGAEHVCVVIVSFRMTRRDMNRGQVKDVGRFPSTKRWIDRVANVMMKVFDTINAGPGFADVNRNILIVLF